MTFLPRGLVVIEVGHDEAAGGSHDRSHTSPDELRRSPLMECGCRWVEGLLVHGIAAHKAIGSTRSCVVSNSHSLGKRFRCLNISSKCIEMAVSRGRPSDYAMTFGLTTMASLRSPSRYLCRVGQRMPGL